MEKIEPTMHHFIDEGKIAGINTLVMQEGEVVRAGCYGMLDMEAGQPVHCSH